MNDLNKLVEKLQRLSSLSAAQAQKLRALPHKLLESSQPCILVHEGAAAVNCHVLVSGYACRSKLTQKGLRQIVSFHYPGDILDSQHLLLNRADHTIQLITQGAVALLPMHPFVDLMHEENAVANAIWRDALIDASIYREWVLNVGRRNARARIAHMLCEFVARSVIAGLGSPEQCSIPLTQEIIADATGLTPIHVNRMLKVLREAGALEGSRGQVRVAKWELLQRIGEFSSDYLHPCP